MKVECVYTVLKSVIIDIDDKYEKLVVDSDYDLENSIIEDAYNVVIKNEKNTDSVSVHGIFCLDNNTCLAEN